MRAFEHSPDRTGDHSVVLPFSRQTRDRRHTREQIDGSLLCGWQAFLLEAKFEQDPLDFGPIAKLMARVRQRVYGTLGVVVSLSDFTGAAVESTVLLRPMTVLLVTRDDFVWAVENCMMYGMLRGKWEGAVKYGEPNFLVATPSGTRP